jgi:hypothetical protein
MSQYPDTPASTTGGGAPFAPVQTPPPVPVQNPVPPYKQ